MAKKKYIPVMELTVFDGSNTAEILALHQAAYGPSNPPRATVNGGVLTVDWPTVSGADRFTYRTGDGFSSQLGWVSAQSLATDYAEYSAAK